MCGACTEKNRKEKYCSGHFPHNVPHFVTCMEACGVKVPTRHRRQWTQQRGLEGVARLDRMRTEDVRRSLGQETVLDIAKEEQKR